MSLTKEQIFSAFDLSPEDVDVPEWGGTIRVIVMSGASREQLQTLIAENKSGFFFEAAVVALSAVDESGVLLFTPDDIPSLLAKNPKVIGQIADASLRINGLGAKAVSEATKNSASSQSDDSGSASASNSESPSSA
jgi:hypothetical protein